VTNPVTVEVLRGEAVESRHRGAISIVDAAGKTVFSLGDVEKPIFPRSAIKALQALPLVESGIADRLGLTAQEISLACSSHSGEPIHVETALSMLKKAGKD
jgi:L-asparaginase II